jgi:serine/threonine protein kinase
MPLIAGTSVGCYEILASLGAGGMGEVYRAKDTKLDREVAIKVLPDSLAQDPERLARFEREAKVLASLNHPNIAQIYGISESDNVRALVMELVEGETLKGPLPFETALDYARQIAEALESAHEKGIVHRDLKPTNVKVTPQGIVKVLDFGLASIAQTAPAAGDPVNSPTLTVSPTMAGMILGTAAYMSPEQARGKPVDKRADIWAFGCVFYEMITGKQLFQGADVSEILAAVIKDQPDLTALPARVRKLLEACLQKDPKKRLQAIGDWRYLLDAGTEDPGQSRARATKVPWAIAAIFAVIAMVLGIVNLREAPPKAILRYTIAAPENTTSLHSFAISPDGHVVAIAAQMNGKHQLWLRALDALQAQPMPSTDDATYPFWSPDNRYIAFFAQGKLKKVAVTGGPAQTLCDAPDARGGSWNRDDVIVFSPGNNGMVGIQRVSARWRSSGQRN